MELKLYQNSKRNKSTYLVTDAVSHITVDCQLKDRCTVENPILMLDFEPVGYNYAYLPKWDRYYFISGWQYSVGVWEISLTEDYLASFKDEILDTTAILAYAHGSEADIVDKRIPVTSELDVSSTTSATFPNFNFLPGGAGTPILCITGKGTNGVYTIDYSDVNSLLDGVDAWFDSDVPDFFSAIKQLIYGGSAANCIKSAITLCYGPRNVGSTSEQIKLGGYPCKDYNGNFIMGREVLPIEEHNTTINIPWKYNDWRRSEPYSVIKLFIPLVGVIAISSEAAKNDSSLDIKGAFNNYSGEVNYLIKGHTSGVILATASASAASPLAIGASNTNVSKIASSLGGGAAAVIGGAATLLTGGAALPAVLGIGGGLAAAAGGTLDGLGGTTQSAGALGGASAIALGTSFLCQVLSRDLSDQPLNFSIRMGKPLFKNTKVGNYSGYVQTEGFQFASLRASSSEKDTINQLLDSGIYVE